jgi:hypothetical protein
MVTSVTNASAPLHQKLEINSNSNHTRPSSNPSKVQTEEDALGGVKPCPQCEAELVAAYKDGAASEVP